MVSLTHIFDPAAAANNMAALLDIIRQHHIVVLAKRCTNDMDRLMDHP